MQVTEEREDKAKKRKSMCERQNICPSVYTFLPQCKWQKG